MKTIAELEVLQLLKRISDGDASTMVIDSRTPAWVEKGRHSRNGEHSLGHTADIGESDPTAVQEVLANQLEARRSNGFRNYDNIKTLVLFCNGPWCGQSSTMIKGLLKIGYPPHKILCYRDGMQNWESLRLTTLEPLAG